MKMKKLTLAALIALGLSTASLSNAMASCPCNSNNDKNISPCEKVTTKCDKCQKEKSKCKCKEEKKAQPTCANCASAQTTDKKDMKQIYSYPNAIYGTNNYVGENSSSITSRETQLNPNIAGATISSESSMTGAASQLPYLNNNMDSISNSNLEDNEDYIDGSTPIDIHTENSLSAIKKSYEPIDLNSNLRGLTGAAANLQSFFPDVPEHFWASCDIDKLAMNDVVVGYPDKLFKPNRNVTRAEFATMLVKGFNMDNCTLEPKCIFSDVPANNWANPSIAKAVSENLLKGYPNGKFMPNNKVTRGEALTAMSKGLNCQVDSCKAQEILSKYKDGKKLPDWSQIPIATAIENGALSDMGSSDMILPNKTASRAEIASMLQNVRVSGGYDDNPKTANAGCPIDKSKQLYLENEEVVKIPTLKLTFLDEINAKSAHVGQHFAATTLEDVTINGQLYPSGSKVIGKVIEVVRPNSKQKGALKLAFTEIQYGDCKAELPKQILNAQINKTKNPHIVARTLAFPFTWAGTLVGTTARATGGMLSNLGNAVENVSNGVGTSLSEVSQGQYKASGRSFADALYETGKAPVDLTRTAISGTMGLFQTSGDEIAYLVDPNGAKISSVNAKSQITIAFGCTNK